MHLFVRQYMWLLFDREANEIYEERRTNITLPAMKVNTPLEFHASKIYARAIFEKFGEILCEGGQYRVEEVEKCSKYYVHRYHLDRYEKWCRVLHIVHVITEGEELSCECGNFEHTGLLCCHSVKVPDFLGIDKIPSKHILNRCTKDAREVVKLGDANPIAYDCAMELLRATMDKLTPLAAEHDGLGLQHRTELKKTKGTELTLLEGAQSGRMSDGEGSAIGNFIGLSTPKHKRKAARPTNSRDRPPYDDRSAKSKKLKVTSLLDTGTGCSTSKRTRFCTICRGLGHKSTTCPQRGDTPQKKRKESTCSICVGGHRKNTCSNPKIVLHVAEQPTHDPAIET